MRARMPALGHKPEAEPKLQLELELELELMLTVETQERAVGPNSRLDRCST